MKYVATWSKYDKSIYGWPVVEGKQRLDFDNSISSQDLKDIPVHVTSNDLRDIPAHAINYVDDFSEVTGIIDLKTKLLQKFNAQGLSKLFTYETVRFLENGNLTIVKGDPIYRAYIFSHTNSNDEYQWKCINVIDLKDFYKCFVLPKGKLLLLSEIPFVISQWDLKSLKFEAQYVLDLNVFKDKDYIDLQLNIDNTLLAVFNHKQDAINLYSTRTSIMISKYVFKNKNTYGIIGVNFISSKNKEYLLVKFYKIVYILVPYSNPVDASKLLQLKLDDDLNSQDEKYLYPNAITSDFIVGVWNKNLWIQCLIRETKEWTDYLHQNFNDYNKIHTYFCTNEIENMIKTTLTKVKSCLANNSIRILTKKFLVGYVYAWIVKETEDHIYLTAWKFNHKNSVWNKVGNMIQSYPSELKQLSSGDLMAISIRGIFIWTACGSDKINLNYYWGSIDITKPNQIYYKSIIDQLDFLNDKLVFSQNYFPPPSIDQLVSHPLLACHMDIITRELFLFDDLLEYYIDDMFFLSLYGTIIIRELIKSKKYEKVGKTFYYFLEQALESMRDGNIYTFTELIDNISALLLDLEFFDENFGFADHYLSKTALLLPDHFEEVFLIQYWGFCKAKYPLFGKIVNSFYSTYFISYPRPTVKLMVPTANFATYSNDYSTWEELICPPTNFFISLNSPDQFKWWNIKALINFKWNTYGRFYYYVNWIIYTAFMLSFTIIATIPPDTITLVHSQVYQTISIILGFFFLTFEIRQFLFDPSTYLYSFWNWIAQRIFSFIVVLGIMVLIFAHSLHLLLRPTSNYSYNQPSYTDDVNNPWNLAPRYQSILSNGTIENESSLIETPDANTNLFALFSTAIVAVYFMLTDSSSVSPWVLKDNPTLVLLLAMFSFFTTIYLMNLFIGLLGMAINETNNVESFLQLKGEVLAEIELFWMLPYQRRRKDWFPDILYYEASIEELQKFVKEAQDENQDTFPSYLSDSIFRISGVDKPLEKKTKDIEIKIDKFEEKLDKIINTHRFDEKLNKILE
ncbi:7240_t:CDS:2, partial [Scutellospora calospora]